LDIEQVFRASSRTIFDVLTEAGGCLIPAYQRPYSWDSSNVTRLLEDATLGLSSLANEPNAVRFLGSIIAVNEPPPRPAGWPRTLLSIIDGQQRLCTLVIFNILIHSKLAEIIRTLEDSENEVVMKMSEEVSVFLDELSKTYAFEYRRDGSVHRFYPRIIRSIDDNWSRDPSEARYVSPISRFTWAYVQHTYGSETGLSFVYRARDDAGDLIGGHEAISVVISSLSDELDKLANSAHETFKLPDTLTLRTNQTYVRELWQEQPPEDLGNFLEGADEEDEELQAVQKMLRLTALARFVNFRMAATIVEASAEDYAFDMFESLNTTGQPLTAFETFKPKVVEQEGADYVTSPSRRSIKIVEEYLDRFKKADERQVATSTLLIPFALAEDGHKLEKHLSYQRRYLRDKYHSAGSRVRRRQFVKSLASVTSFVASAWRPLRRQDPQLLPDPAYRDDEAEFCFEALRKSNHEITIAPLSRFYAAFQDAELDNKENAAHEFFGAVKAVTAFSMIWRAAFGNTANIDNAYREVMAEGVGGAPPLCRRPEGATSTAPTVENLRTALCAKLAAARIDRDRWIRDASQAAIYKTGQGVTRFLLLAAAHDTVPDPTNPGFLTSGRRGSLPLMSRSSWNDAIMNSVEHVAPDARNSAGWPDDLYEDLRTVQSLGNFILMPSLENRVLGNKPWSHKRILYQIFGASTAQEARVAIANGRSVGFESSRTVRDLVEQSSVLPMCASVKNYSGPWDKDFVNRRSSHLAERAWDQIYQWLSPVRTARRNTRTRGRRSGTD
jgi:hypothetical protein